MDVSMTSAGVVGAGEAEAIETATDLIRLLVADRDDVQVAEYTSDDRDGPPPHRRPGHEIEYVLDGEVKFWVDGEWHRATAGDVQVLPAGEPHSVRIPEGEGPGPHGHDRRPLRRLRPRPGRPPHRRPRPRRGRRRVPPRRRAGLTDRSGA